MRNTLCATVLMILLASSLHAGVLVNVGSEYAQGKTYGMWTMISEDCRTCCGGMCTLVFRAEVPSDSPYRLDDRKQFICGADINGVELPYLGNGLWSNGASSLALVTMGIGVTSYETMDPSWAFENRRPSSLATPFPAISLGSAIPGQQRDIFWQVQVAVSGTVSGWSLWQETYGYATPVPEPSTVVVVLSGLGLTGLIRRRLG